MGSHDRTTRLRRTWGDYEDELKCVEEKMAGIKKNLNLTTEEVMVEHLRGKEKEYIKLHEDRSYLAKTHYMETEETINEEAYFDPQVEEQCAACSGRGQFKISTGVFSSKMITCKDCEGTGE